VDACVVNADANRRRHRDDNDDLGVGCAVREDNAPTGKSDREVSQPVQPFPGVVRRSFDGFQVIHPEYFGQMADSDPNSPFISM